MIFVLLEQIVTLQITFTSINVKEPSFQGPLTWAFIVRSSRNDRGRNRCRRSRIQNGPQDLLEVILQVSNHRGVGGAKSSKRSDNRCSSGNKSTCRGGSREATDATFGRGSANKFVFAVVGILARTVTSGESSY